MRKYKKLQQNIDSSIKDMGEKELLRVLKCSVVTKKRNFNKKLILGLASSVVSIMLVIVVVTCVVFLPNKNIADNTQPPPPYYSGNEVKKSSTIAELNSYTENFDIDNSLNWVVSKFYDSVSNEVLYFVISAEKEDVIQEFLLTIIVADNYQHQESNYNYNLSFSIKNHTMNYLNQVEEYPPAEEYPPLYSYTTYAKIITSKEEIYIRYLEITFEENLFLSAITNILK